MTDQKNNLIIFNLPEAEEKDNGISDESEAIVWVSRKILVTLVLEIAL